MATIRSNTTEKIFAIKRWLGLNEAPDGDTKLKSGEAAAMRNFKVTRDGNLKIRDGSDILMGLCETYAIDESGDVVEVLFDEALPSILVMYPTAAVTADGKVALSGASAQVTDTNASTYYGYYWRQDKFHVWKFTGYDGGHWFMKPVKAVSSSANKKVAGLWTGMVSGHEYVLAACDGKLWKLCTDGVWAKAEIGAVDTAGTVHVFGFGGIAYILDGSKYRQWDGSTYAEVDGYVPIVSVTTAPAGGGQEYEQVNKLSANRKVWFSPDGTSTVFQLPETDLDSIDHVVDRATGNDITPSGTDLANGTVTITPAPAAGSDTIEIEYAVKTDFRAQVEAMRFSELYNGAQDTRVFLYGDGSNQVFYSGLDYDGTPRADYFPDMNVAAVGTENTPVTGLLRQYSRMVAFKSDSTYVITYGSITLESGLVTAGFYINTVNRSIGCTPMGQVRLVLNNARTLHGQDCYEWQSNRSGNLTQDERQAQRISDRVYATLASFDTADCVCWDDDYNQEYYICYNGRALVHNYAANAWYYYNSFDARCFLSYGGRLYYGTGDGELRFLSADEHSNAGEPIDAYWESGSMAFDADYRRKYSAQIWVGLKPVEDSEIIVTVQTDKKSVYTEKVVQRKMATFAKADFSDWSFNTNYKPFMQRLKIKAKKFTFYKMIFKSNSATTGATLVAVDMRVRFNGYVK